jgi:hypothetical protein
MQTGAKPGTWMTTGEVWLVFATLFAPLGAVQATRWLDGLRDKRRERVALFRTLMATRAARLDQKHIQALNMIDVVFAGRGRRDETVRDAWRVYLAHLSDRSYAKEHWEDRRKELLVDLLAKIGELVGYRIDRSNIYPQ